MTARKNPARAMQTGPESRLTAAEIERIRAIYDALYDLRRQQKEICAELGITRSVFSRYGTRRLGKKPRTATRRKVETIDWIASHPNEAAA